MQYFLPDGWYQVLKWIGLCALPAISVAYGTIAPIWGWPNPEGVVITINAIGVLIGALIGASQLTAKPAPESEEPQE